MRNTRKRLKKRKLSTVPTENLLQEWLIAALQIDRMHELIPDRLVKGQLQEIQF